MGGVCGCNRATAIFCKREPAWSTLEDAKSRLENNKRVEEARRARVEWLQKLKEESASQQEFDTVRSQSVWTQLDSSSCAQDLSPPEALERIRQENRLHFQHLMDTQSSNKSYPLSLIPFKEVNVLDPEFFVDFGDDLKAGMKIGGGAQADIHEAIYNGEVLEWCVLKVFKSNYLLADLQCSWTKDVVVCSWMWSHRARDYMNCCGVRHGTLLQDGRFAFILQRCWGDLRKAIDLQIVKDKTHLSPPFGHLATIRVMRSIAWGMHLVHDTVEILHRDLKAANCFLLKDPESDLLKLSNCLVGDFDTTEGVEGTRFWRAPEVLLALRNKQRGIYSSEEVWTKKADVYSYAMTCYEVLTGCVPFDDIAANDYDSVIGGERPPFPDYVDLKLQDLVRRCWHSEPSMRPSFKEIIEILEKFIEIHARKKYWLKCIVKKKNILDY